MRKQQHHTSEFKAEAIELAKSSDKGVSEIARDLGINAGTLYRWIAEAEREGKGDTGVSMNQGSDLQAEVKRLQRELETVRQERDILKKAISVFSRDQR
jgi:transposase